MKYAAEYVGGEAYDCAIFIHKGVSPRSHDHRGRWMEMLEGSVSGTSTIDTQSNVHPEEFGLPAAFDPFDAKMVGYHLGSMVGRLHFIDSLGICKFTANTYHEFVCQALSASTGWDYTKEEAMAFWKRCAAMFRLFNLRNGIGPESEKTVGAVLVHAGGRSGRRDERQRELGHHDQPPTTTRSAWTGRPAGPSRRRCRSWGWSTSSQRYGASRRRNWECERWASP